MNGARERSWTLVAIASAMALLLLTVAVMTGATATIDLSVQRWLVSVTSAPLDFAVNAHTAAGQVVTTVTVAVGLALIAARRWGGLAWLAPLFLLATGVVELGLKSALYHPSPPAEFIRATGNPLGIHVQAPSAFPSGHVTRITFLAIMATQLWAGAPVRLAAFVLVAFTLFARMYIGDHWLSDVLGGLALGTLAASAGVIWALRTRRRG